MGDDIKEFEHIFNLISTHTVEDAYEYHVIKEVVKNLVNKKDSISLYYLVDSFNKMYNCFKKELSELPRLDFEGSFSYRCYVEGKERTSNKDFQFLVLHIDGSRKKRANLIMQETEGVQECYRTDEWGFMLGYGINKTQVSIDESTVRKYLDFFQKYEPFLKTYTDINNKLLFTNGTTTLESNINGNVMKDLTTFTLRVANYYPPSADLFEIPIALGNDIKIDYDHSKAIYNSNPVENKKEVIDELLKNLYVFREDISQLYGERKESIFLNNEEEYQSFENNGPQRKLIPNTRKDD